MLKKTESSVFDDSDPSHLDSLISKAVHDAIQLKSELIKAAFKKMGLPWDQSGFNKVTRVTVDGRPGLEHFDLFHGTEHQLTFIKFVPSESGLGFTCESV